jgi:hypothetical protein
MLLMKHISFKEQRKNVWQSHFIQETVCRILNYIASQIDQLQFSKGQEYI